METFIQSVVSGLLTGSLYAMIGIGLTVIFGVMRIINMAHGDMVMLGMYGAFISVAFLKIDPFLSIVIWFPIAFLLGAFIYRFLLKNIVPAGELNTLLYTAGLSLFIANFVLFIGTGDYRTIKLKYAVMPLRPFGIAVPIPLAIAFGMAILITIALYWFLRPHRYRSGHPGDESGARSGVADGGECGEHGGHHVCTRDGAGVRRGGPVGAFIISVSHGG